MLSVAMLRGSWLINLYESGGRIRRRQELPPEAFISAEELKKLKKREAETLAQASPT